MFIRIKKHLELLENERKYQTSRLKEAIELHKSKEREIEIKNEDIIRRLKIDHEDSFRKFKIELEDQRVKESLDLQVKTAQQLLDSKKELQEKIHILEMEKANFKSELEKDFYEKLKDSLNDFHTKGNITTNFIQELALKMMDSKSHKIQIEKQD